MASEWFRRSTWGAQDERGFFAKLAKARSWNRAQYLRIQAVHLASARPPLHEAALSLLAYLMAHHPEPSEMSMAHCQMAESLVELGRFDEARGHYRQAIQWMRDLPSSRNGAWKNYALMVATHRLANSYEEALDVLDEFRGDIMFPVDHFDWHAARALIFSQRGEEASAREEAAAALAAAGVDHSGFRHHPGIGLVGVKRTQLRRQMEILAENPRNFLQRLTRLFH